MTDPVAAIAPSITSQSLEPIKTLPISSPSQNNVKHFEAALQQKTESEAILKKATPANSLKESGSINDSLMNKIKKMDQSYHGILNQFQQIPHTRSALMEKMDLSDKEKLPSIRTNEALLDKNSNMSNTERMEKLLDRSKKQQTFGIEFTHSLSNWSINTQLWSAGMKVITSAVNQMSQGVKTLFRSGGG